VNVSDVVTFQVTIEVLSPNKSLLKPEMTANVEIVAAEKDKALLVPAEAVTRQRGKPVVAVARTDGATEERQVDVGITDDVSVEILSGLSEGESVVVQKGQSDSRWRSNSTGPRGPGLFPGGPRR